MSLFTIQGRKVPTDISDPQPVGVCDRTGFLIRLSDMPFQYQWRGNALVNLNIRVGTQYLDKPSEFLRPPLIGPEPVPPKNQRPTAYAQQNAGGEEAPTVQEILGWYGQ